MYVSKLCMNVRLYMCVYVCVYVCVCMCECVCVVYVTINYFEK